MRSADPIRMKPEKKISPSFFSHMHCHYSLVSMTGGACQSCDNVEFIVTVLDAGSLKEDKEETLDIVTHS